MRLRNVKNANEILENSKYFIKDFKNNKGKYIYGDIFSKSQPIHLEIGLVIGLFLLFIYSCCKVASDADDYMEELYYEKKNK